jgi:hypothetical protein
LLLLIWVELLDDVSLVTICLFFAESEVSLLEEASPSIDCVSELVHYESLRTEVGRFHWLDVVAHFAYLFGLLK